MHSVTTHLDAAFLRDAWSRSRTQRCSLDVYLCDKTGLSTSDMLAALGQAFHYGVCLLGEEGAHTAADTPALDRMGLAECRRLSAMVVLRGTAPVLLFANPIDDGLQRWADATGIAAHRRELVPESALLALLARLESASSALPGALGQVLATAARPSGIEEISLARIDETASPVVRLIHSTLFDAMGAEASDIHLEAVSGGLVVKYRIDGVIHEAAKVGGVELSEQAISRVKVMAELDITERRTPQDGRFRARIRDRDIDFRVSIMPSIHGEDAVIRILDKEHLSDQMAGLTLDHLGFDEVPMRTIRTLAAKPYGMLLITGPTGSGKTTTLYAALSEINDGTSKIITIEDPVEYQVPGILQIPVNERKGLTFSRGLRSILRHDPDKIMVGEIRDPDTAQIAVQAALTGHLVFSTVHANNVFDVLGRFEHMQVDPYAFVGALNGIVAQRLVRVFCTHCAGRGCADCRGTGLKGRRAIGECLVLDDELRELIAAHAPVRSIKETARQRGTRTLRESAMELVERGLTSQAEIDRVTFA
ncbi:GspE/PulE family protein [Candidatus Symbiobacter mobilis]|uniref:General secretion pathway protein E n=1 Tax=Candidatus Symbiobacter mobilis CR TaxID=946483 RepID=U5NAI0_9BURK|nr:GspE/PulE family protein [Candidatus Symbiobacter mobilis]AGX88561.1 general secretion pathway protein E [Candidatus Symbiobacter mobilis CR]